MSDPLFAQVELLCGFNGTDGSTTIVDEGPDTRTITTVANAQLDTAQKRFGTAALLLDGVGDQVTVADNAALELGALDFTLEAWVRFASSKTHVIATKRPNDGVYGSFLWYRQITSNLHTFRATSDNGSFAHIDLVSATPVIQDSWHHLAVTRSGNIWRLFDNGELADSQTTSLTVFNNSDVLRIGGDTNSANSVDGWMDEFRLTIGTARYTGPFYLPRGPFTRGKRLGTLGDYRQPIVIFR